jgi:prepilin-type N-terminal cleavage/methylation domain-containing protein
MMREKCQSNAVRPTRRGRVAVRRGFTLVELIATTVVLAALGSVASSLLISAINAYSNSAIQAQLHNEQSIAMERIVRELRKCPRDTSASSTAPMISTVTANSITWNGSSTLSLSGSQLMFADAGATARPLLSNVTDFQVQTYDESNTALGASLSGSACNPIRRVNFLITSQRSGVTETLTTRVFIRSTMVGNS